MGASISSESHEVGVYSPVYRHAKHADIPLIHAPERVRNDGYDLPKNVLRQS